MIVSSDSIPYQGKGDWEHKESKTEVFVIPKSSASSELSNKHLLIWTVSFKCNHPH